MALMIIPLEELQEEYPNVSAYKLTRKIKAVESAIRAYTNNNFNNRSIRYTLPSSAGVLNGTCTYFKCGDVVEIADGINKGFYSVKDSIEGTVTLDRPLLESEENIITLVEYPDDVVECAWNMMEYDINQRTKAGIQSETISRHSVTYFSQDSGSFANGFPTNILGSLKPYRKVRCCK